MDHIWKDFRFALRNLRRSFGVTLLATSSLALAIAGNTMVFSLVNGLLYRPMPFDEPHRLHLIGETARGDANARGFASPTSDANFLDIAERQTSYEGIAGVRTLSMQLDTGDSTEALTANAVTTDFFSVLGDRAHEGRLFLPEEMTMGGERVAVLTHKYWVESFNADPGAVDESLHLNGHVYDIIGVLPVDHEFLNPSLDLYVPLALDRAHLDRQLRDMLVVARLRDGVEQEAARAELTAIMTQLEDEYPKFNRGYTLQALNMREDIPDPVNRAVMALLQGAMFFVMLIAIANIANMLLARGQSREREIAVRTSIGATRGRIIGQLLIESMVMASAAGLLGIGLGYAGVRVINNALASLMPSFFAPVLDVRVAIFTLLITLVGGALFGLAPVLQTRRFNLVDALKDGSHGAGGGGKKRFAANALVVAEIALSLMLLAGASVMIQTFKVIQSSDPGFRTENILTMSVSLPADEYADRERLATRTAELGERLGALPGVDHVLMGNVRPRTVQLFQQAFTIDAQPLGSDQAPPRVAQLNVTPSFLTALGIDLESGRSFAAADRLDAAPVVIVNQAMAERYWPDRDPIGERVTFAGASREIVGVVETVRHGLAINNELSPMVYLPWAQTPQPTFAVSLMTAGEAADLAELVRAEVQGFEAGASLANVQTLDAFIEQFYVGQNVLTVILGGFGALALVLAALGTYGVLAYSVVQRTHEIGVRIAIGAGRGQVLGMVTRQGLTLAAIGIAIGIPGVIAITRTIASALASIVPVEPLTVLGVGTVLVLVTLVASFIPARRAAGVDPITALRCD